MKPDIEKMLLPWIGKAGKFGSYYLTEMFRENDIGLTKEQFILLIKLSEKDGCPQSALAIITSRDKTSLARLIANMEKKGLVRREISQKDKRRNLVFLTPKGEGVLQKAFPFGMQATRVAQEGITEEELTITIGVLKKVLENIKLNKDDGDCCE